MKTGASPLYRGEHGFDDVLSSYSGVWHKQALSNLAKEKLG